jgi:1,4-dihydroxy-2-naphthoate octaprenyltransferase
VGSFASVVIIGISQPWALLGLLALPLAVAPVRTILTRSDPPSLVQVLVATSKVEVVVAVLVSVGLCLS